MLEYRVTHIYKDRKRMREEAKSFEGQKRELVKAMDVVKAELKVEQENHLLTRRLLKSEQERVKKMEADLDKATRACDSHRKKWEEERQRRLDMQNKNDKLQFELIAMHQDMEVLYGQNGKAVIEAFKKSPEFKQLQLDFARPA